MGVAITVREMQKMPTRYWSEPEVKERLGDLGVDGWVITLKWILEKYIVRAWNGASGI